MVTITPLKTVPKTCNESVVRLLEAALERAKSGEVVAVAIAEVQGDGAIGRGWSSSDPTSPLLGAIAILQHDLLLNCDD